MTQSAVNLSHIGKKYILHHEKPTLVENIFFRGQNEVYWALKNVDIQVKPGDKLGIIGPNGSGKTTLLKIIAGVTSPSTGQVTVYGKLVSLIGLSAGFHPELTGLENIFLNGLLIGMSNREIKTQLDSIIAFADIGTFIDAPFYTYSTGMQLRVGFSIAVHSNPDIFVLDEGLSTGDEDFKQKSFKKIQEFFAQGKTIILVSHQLDFISEHCNRAIYLDHGQIAAAGTPKSTIKSYLSSNH